MFEYPIYDDYREENKRDTILEAITTDGLYIF